ncbi:hypothetical protein SAMN00017405_1123 [Desulfonispora thiosulfatigenes DSM 11270]|uniref:Uncharacterized protein n=1 Tax=Desulfonispora thiosulfatigenes DSM 11270 TaxID=656914 RepID=A0A1W1UYD4_DESTI|nr:hypothetical protein [Desulfonispora thiosulfatigenes]SMB86118.1 hypothetical protein SAMN00017405_1123 [Desulfonispora thiosulfatigenes DSM 11270]
MSNSNIEKMKRIIAEKKKASAEQGLSGERASKKIGKQQTVVKQHKKGGLFDK